MSRVELIEQELDAIDARLDVLNAEYDQKNQAGEDVSDIITEIEALEQSKISMQDRLHTLVQESQSKTKKTSIPALIQEFRQGPSEELKTRLFKAFSGRKIAKKTRNVNKLNTETLAEKFDRLIAEKKKEIEVLAEKKAKESEDEDESSPLRKELETLEAQRLALPPSPPAATDCGPPNA